MGDFKRYLGYGLKGLVSVPLALAGGQATAEYNEAVGDSAWIDDPDKRAEVEMAAGRALDAQGFLVALWRKPEED